MAAAGPDFTENLRLTVEPKRGRSDAEVALALQHAGAREVETLAPGFISAIVPLAFLHRLRDIAEVHPKVRKQPVSGRGARTKSLGSSHAGRVRAWACETAARLGPGPRTRDGLPAANATG